MVNEGGVPATPGRSSLPAVARRGWLSYDAVSDFVAQDSTLTSHHSRYRFVIAGLVLSLFFSGGLTFLAVTPVFPLIIDDYGISRSAASLLVSSVALANALLAIPGGILVARVGPHRVIVGGWLLASAPALSVFADDFATLLALRLLFGVGFAFMLPAVAPVLMRWFPPKELPLVNSLLLGALTVGISVSAFVGAPISEAVGWRWLLTSYGLLMLAGAMAWLVFGSSGSVSTGPGSRVRYREIWGIMRSRLTLLLVLADLGPYAQFAALMAWLPTFYHEALGMSLSRAGLVVGVLPGAGVFMLLLAGALSLRVANRRPFLVVPGIVVGFAGMLAVLGTETYILYPAMLLLAFGSWFYVPVLLTLPMEQPGASEEQVALTWSVLMSLGSVGAFAAPLFVGAIRDVFGSYVPGLLVFAVLSWSLVAGGLLLPKGGRGAVPQPEPLPTGRG